MFDRRQFLRTVAVGAVGAGVAWRYGGTLALGQIPVDQKLDMPPIAEADGFDLPLRRVLGEGIKNEAPRLAVDSTGRLWAAWISEQPAGEVLMLTSFDGSQWSAEESASGAPASVMHPAILAMGAGVALAWSVCRGPEDWIVRVRTAAGESVELAGAAVTWRPALALDGQGRLWAVVEEKGGGAAFRVRAHRIEGGRVAQSVDISPAGAPDCMRPSAATDRDGNVQVVWDQADGINGPHVYLASLSPAGDTSAPVRISDHPASNISPSVAVDGENRVWIAWHSNRKGTEEWDIPRWYYLRAYHNGQLSEPVAEPLGKDLTKEGTDQSFEFPRVYAAADGKVLVTGRPSHNFCLQYYHGNSCSPLYRLPVDTWGGRGQFLAAAFAPDGSLWVARRDIGENVLNRITGLESHAGAPQLRPANAPANAAPAIVNIHRKPVWEPLEGLEGIAEPLNYYYGDIHGHTWMSDGMGDVDEYYHIRRDYYADDFASLTDHDTFVRKSILPTYFEYMQEMTAHYHEDGRFVTLFGQEYTTARYPAGLGHKNVYSTNRRIPLFDHTDAHADTSQKLNALCREWGALVIPHHIAWTGTDWENVDERVQRLVEIVSNHGVFEYMGNEPIAHRGGIPGHFVQDGLARGLKFGLIGGSDNHGLVRHHGMAYKRDSYRTGLAVVLAPELTREAIFDAMMKRRVFATTGVKPRLDFRVNGHLMGEEITITEPRVTINVDLSCTDRIRWITIVKNNRDWQRYGGEGFRSFFTKTDELTERGTHYYYLRAELYGGDMVWSSPVWVTRA